MNDKAFMDPDAVDIQNQNQAQGEDCKDLLANLCFFDECPEVQSELILCPSRNLLETIKQVAEEMFATSKRSSFLASQQNGVEDDETMIKAKNKLQALGLNADQIKKVLRLELNRIQERKKKVQKNILKKKCKNLVQVGGGKTLVKTNPRNVRVNWQ